MICLQFSRVRPRREEAPSSFVQRMLHDVSRGDRPRKVSRASFCIARALTGISGCVTDAFPALFQCAG